MNLLFTFEGGEGSGKTTVSTIVSNMLKEENIPFISTREPGGVKSAESIRDIILNENMNGVIECLLFAAARRQHLIEKVIPALKNGQVILMDRYLDSSLVYQGIARNLNDDGVFLINRLAITKDSIFLSDEEITSHSDTLGNILTQNSSRFDFTMLGEKINSIILNHRLDPVTILLLKTAINCANARSEYSISLEDKIIAIEEVINKVLKNDSVFTPNVTFILDIEPVVGIERIMSNSDREVNRLDKEDLSFHEKIRKGYIDISKKYNDSRNFLVVNANDNAENIAKIIFKEITSNI